MWTRSELKSRAKAAVKRNYVACILVALLLLFALGKQDDARVITGIEGVDGVAVNAIYQFYYSYLAGAMQVVWNIIFSLLGGLSYIAMILLGILVFNPIEVGGCAFFTENSFKNSAFDRVIFVFKDKNYWNVVKTLLIRDLKLYLWYMLFVIPGVVKSLEYRMVPYLLAEDPNVSMQDAFMISKEMMYGQKMNAFILDLSFVLWDMLSALTFGLAGIFFVNPYAKATNAELYLVLREKYLSQNHNEYTRAY